MTDLDSLEAEKLASATIADFDRGFGADPNEAHDLARAVISLIAEQRRLKTALGEALGRIESWVQSETQHADYTKDVDWIFAAALRKEFGL